MVTLGVNNGFAMKRWPEPKEWCRVIADELQVEKVQLSLDIINLHQPWRHVRSMCREIRQQTAEKGLQVDSVFTGLADYSRNMLLDPDPVVRNWSFEYYKTALDACEALEVPVFGGHLGAFSVATFNSTKRDVLEQVLFEFIEELSSYARRAGLRELLWEAMPLDREPPHTVEEAKAYLGRANEATSLPVYLCFDVGHACAQGNVGEQADPYHWLAELAEITTMVHLQQTDGQGDRHWAFTPEMNEQGIIEPERVMSVLRSSLRSRVKELVIEVFPAFEAPDDQVIKDMRDSVEHWRGHVTG